MKVNFIGRSISEREAELSQEELVLLFDVMKQKFLNNIEFGTFDRHSYSPEDKAIKQLCQNHQVDASYPKDRLAFFRAIMDKLENPYK
jgi:hypothetical protein